LSIAGNRIARHSPIYEYAQTIIVEQVRSRSGTYSRRSCLLRTQCTGKAFSRGFRIRWFMSMNGQFSSLILHWICRSSCII
jgi:hypothetical protein